MTGSRAFRVVVVLLVLAAAGLVAASALATERRSERGLATLDRQLVASLNRFRVEHGLRPLRESAALERSASQHSFEMGRDGYFGHASADGTAFWRRIERYYGPRHHRYWSVGENLLWASPGVSASRALRMWIASPEHLRNLLAARWRDVGVSAVHVLHAPGVFHGLAVTIVTADFGVRS